MFGLFSSRRIVCACVAACLLAGAAGWWWLCAQSADIDFLPAHGPAQWIVYPKPADGAIHRAAEWTAEFRRAFQLEQKPGRAQLSLRAFKSFRVQINGLMMADSQGVEGGWKAGTAFDVARALRAGTNEIVVSVTSDRGPPALWLSLDAGESRVRTDAQWEASLAGAAWRNAKLASAPPEIAPGNPLFGGVNAADALVNEWPALAVFALVAGALLAAGRWWLRARANAASALPFAVLAIAAVLWAALFVNNVGQLPRRVGFDVDAHLDYVQFIRAHHALPLATDGWEMCQPPLYYAICAALLAPLKAAAASDQAIHVLRMFGLLLGVVHLALILLSLRLVFPGQIGCQCFGLALAAFLPAHLYMSQYVTNEALSALLVTAAIYFCLRIVKSERLAAWQFAAVGLCLGGALLTKVTALFAAPFLFAAMGARLASEQFGARREQNGSSANPGVAAAGRQGIGVWLRTVGVALLTTFVVCGWHYLRVWKHFGSPIVHDWDPASGFAWWTDEGVRTGSFLTRFGGCLAHPFYSVFRGFGNGLYSTLWGDGLCGGVIQFDRRPPWNYELMAAGFLLALAPTVVIVVGSVCRGLHFLRQPDAVSLMLLGVPLLTLAALAYMNVKLPFYCNTKAFYCLTALLPLCALGAQGWLLASRLPVLLRGALLVLMAVWAMASYASFWIRPETAFTRTTRGWYLAADGRNDDAMREFSAVLERNPHDAPARKGLAVCLWQLNRLDEARTQTAQALADAPDDADGHLQLASILALQGKLNDAVHEAETASALGPDLAAAWVRRCGWLTQLERWEESIAAGREALRIEPMNAEAHLDIGVALTALGRHKDALTELRAACEFKPSLAEAHDRLGLSLAAQNRWPEAVDEFDAARRLKPDESSFHYHLALAAQAIGQDHRAVEAYRHALRLNADLQPALNNLAWLLATHADPRLRSGTEAVRLAERAVVLTDGQDAPCQATLAAAYAEAGQYPEAIQSANRALQLALASNQKDLTTSLREQLELYKSSHPFHQRPPSR